jgi:solute carrier family 30 (zinc transporter), member 1
MIASVHIQVSLPSLNRTKRYHSIARAIRTCLHAYGIHSSTIQPEFADDLPGTAGKSVPSEHGDDEDTPLLQDGSNGKGCLFECVGECEDSRCCDDSTNSSKDSKKGTGNGTGYGSGA